VSEPKVEIILDEHDDAGDYHTFDNIDTSSLPSSSQLPDQQSSASAISFDTTGQTTGYTCLFDDINQTSDVPAPSTSGFINPLSDLTIQEDDTLADLTTGMPKENASKEHPEDDLQMQD
jgi:hypothetical protein